jgi:transporter family-2 protein
MLMKLAPFAAIAVAAGVAATFQGAANSGLASRTGIGPAVLVNCVLVFLGALVFWAVLGARRDFFPAETPWTLYLGGIFGLAIVIAMAYVFPKIGGAMAIACMVLGQGIAALLADHFGLMGLPRNPVTLTRIAGVLLVAGGVVLIRW